MSNSSFLVSVSVPQLSTTPYPTLIDCGASDNFIDASIAPLHMLRALREPISLHLFDGSPTPSGFITHAVTLEITVPGFPPKEVLFYLTKLHPLAKLVLGLSWLRLENPIIDWKALTVFPSQREVATIGRNPPSFSMIPELCVQDPILAVPMHVLPLACQAPIPHTPTQSVLEPYNSQDPFPMVPTHTLDLIRLTPASHASAYSTLEMRNSQGPPRQAPIPRDSGPGAVYLAGLSPGGTSVRVCPGSYAVLGRLRTSRLRLDHRSPTIRLTLLPVGTHMGADRGRF